MKKNYLLLLILLVTNLTFAQVGINTTTPNAQLEIKSSSEIAPAPTDGLLIPKVNVFPATNPTVAQQGMLVYLTTTVGTNQPGFYFWDSATTNWKPITGATSGGTLDQAYDFGGAGLGKTITADAGAVLINGTDGLISTGTFGSGAIAPVGVGTKMFWNPRKAAFRAGGILGSSWDDANIGIYSFASGFNTIASGDGSVAFGGSEATGDYSSAFGFGSQAIGITSTAFGNSVRALGAFSTAFGQGNDAIGSHSTVLGVYNDSRSFGETVLGIGATSYITSTNGTNQFRAANATDRLFVIGNAVDINNNNFPDTAERSDAMIVLKNGLTRLPSTTNAMITAADGKAVVTKEYLQSTASGTLDQAYDFGGAGLGRTITADAGAVLIDGTDGFVSTGTFGSGALAPSGGGVKMFWNPRKAAFRAGQVSSTDWDDVNVGDYSFAFGKNNKVSDDYSVAFGENNTVSRNHSEAFGNNNFVLAGYSAAFGSYNRISVGGYLSFAVGNNNQISSERSFALGENNLVNGRHATAIGLSNVISGHIGHAFGSSNYVGGTAGAAIGLRNYSLSSGEIAIGIGCTDYTPSTNGATEWGPANATDRIFVIGNAIDTNNNNNLDAAERRDAMIVLKNGLTRLPSTTNAMITAADGKAVVTKEYLEQNGSWRVTGNVGTTAANFIGTTDLQPFTIRTNNATRARILATGEFGIGTTSPDRKLEVSGTGIQYGRITTTGSSAVGIEFKRTGSGNDWQIRNDGGDLIFGQSNDELVTVTDVVRVGGTSFTPVTDNFVQLGQLARRWTAVCAINGVIQTSDANDKKEMLPINYGLETIKSLRPISFQ